MQAGDEILLASSALRTCGDGGECVVSTAAAKKVILRMHIFYPNRMPKRVHEEHQLF